jgi:hypothetical protein
MTTEMTMVTAALGVAGALCLLLALCGESSADWFARRREDKRQRAEAMEWAIKRSRHEAAEQMMREYRLVMNPYHGHQIPWAYREEQSHDG